MRYWKPYSFPKALKVGIGVATYLNGPEGERRFHQLRALLSCFMAQTYPHWHACLVHDGPIHDPVRAQMFASLHHEKIHLITTPKRESQFGHPHRQTALNYLTPNSTWLGLTNDDNLYAPCYFEWLLGEAIKAKAEFVYSDMIHSHKWWKPFTTAPRRGKLDLGGFLVRKEICEKVPFPGVEFDSDGIWINRLMQKTKRVAKVSATLFMHN